MKKKVPVSQRAIMARIKRALAKEGKALKISRSHMEREHYGDAFVIDLGMTQAVKAHVDLKELALELGVLKAYEEMTDE